MARLLTELCAAGDATEIANALFEAADELGSEALRGGHPNHWLCETLSEAADAIDPSTYQDLANAAITDVLKEAGMMPSAYAAIAATLMINLAQKALTPVDPLAHSRLVLRCLALLVCPEPDECPVGKHVILALGI